jgi:hypothetical protein
MDDTKGGLFRRARPEELVLKEIPIARLQDELKSISGGISQLLDATTDGPGKLHLTELSVQVEVTASGGINLIGAAATVGAGASLTLTFSRQS